MRRAWLITNPASGSTSPARVAEVAALLTGGGATLAGQTNFPAEPLPEVAALTTAGVDTVVLLAGDGTINAAVHKLARWPGQTLILPGGTMNLLARTLHGEADSATIVARLADARLASLPFVTDGPHRAFVGLILGPAAHWVRAREAARKGKARRFVAAVRNAWRRTFASGIRLRGAGTLHGRYQAVLVQPTPTALSLAAIDARNWRSIATLGWDWLTDDWMAARAVTTEQTKRFAVAGDRPVLALVDGEPVLLEPGTTFSSGTTSARYLATQPA